MSNMFWPQISVYARTSAQIVVDSVHLVAGVGAAEAPITISKTITDTFLTGAGWNTAPDYRNKEQK